MKFKDPPINPVDQKKRTNTGNYALITAEFGIDIETNQILSLEVTDEATQDDQVFETLLESG